MDKKFQLFRQPDQEAAAAEAGEYLNRRLIQAKNQPLLLLLSGGSAFSLLNYVGSAGLGANLSISVLDERFSEAADVNNFAQLQKTDFYTLAFDAECSFFGTLPRTGETMEMLAKRWGNNLRQWRQENPDGQIISTLGMGTDGHTAGMFPMDDEKKFTDLFQGDSWITGYNAGEKSQYPERVTATLTFFKLIDLGLAFVCGSGKKQKLDELLLDEKHCAGFPASGWHEIKQVKIFTDIN